MAWTCEIEAAWIVLLGKFNPAIFQPAWLAAHGLIREKEAEDAKIEIIRPEACVFTADWFQMQVLQDRFLVSTTNAAQQGALRDLVIGVFQLLEHTPFDKMGINRESHYRVDSRDKWHALGDLLAPKEPWQGIVKGRPGLRRLVIEGLREESSPIKLNVTVEPSVPVDPGVYVHTNEHHEAAGSDSARQLLTTLRDCWDESQAYAKRIGEHLLNQRY